jgi:hypothetical protein
MHPSKSRRVKALLVCLFAAVLTVNLFAQGTSGRIQGRVSDQTGAVLAGAKVALINEENGIKRESVTNEGGDYIFLEVPVGDYRVEVDLPGFKKVVRRQITLQLSQVLSLNLTLQLGEAKEVVEVTSEAPLVDTSSTQLGAVINDRSIAQLPLSQRNTYQFLSLQPGVQSQVGADLYAGSDNAGSVSVNGGRGRANNFSVNGGDANDLFVNTPTVQPSPDAVEEFRILTNAFDAEYGRNSGSVVNVVTKSGGNQFHGNVYEFLRNDKLNARGFFDNTKGAYHQNQFGFTFGGPVRKDHTFFFLTYEGDRIRQGRSGDTVAVPTGDIGGTTGERNGDFSADGPNPMFVGAIKDSTVADLLNGRPGCTGAINALGGLTPSQGANWSAIFPTNAIPTECQDPVAVDLMNRFVPGANAGDFFQAVLNRKHRQDQGTLRIDHRINDKQNFSAYYYFTDNTNFEPFNNFQAAGANVPGFGAAARNRYQQINLSHTWTVSNAIVNEARFSFMREGQKTANHSEKTNLVTDSCTSAASAFCFTGTSDSQAINDIITASGIAPGKAGITPGLGAGREGVPDVAVSGGFTLGNNFEGELPQVGNSFQWTDSLTWVKGNHTMKFGGDVRRMRFDQTLYFEVSGFYNYFGNCVLDDTTQKCDPNQSGNDPGFFTATDTQDINTFTQNFYPNYLLGLPDQYQQGSANSENVRTTSLYLFAQDSWKLRHNITLNYGLRWELNTPLKDVGKRLQTFRPGQATQIYPCLDTGSNDCASVFPTGLVVPGDKGIPDGLTQTYYHSFAPRIGIAWDPRGNGKTSIRAGWGLFYNPVEQLVLEQFSAEPPFGVSLSLTSPLFNTPFVAQDGSVAPNGANGILDPPRNQPLDWAVYRPILLFGQFQPKQRSQYAAQYNLNIQHELTRDLQLQIGYVGSQGHRLLASYDINRANPQTCLDIHNLGVQGVVDVNGNKLGCGPFGEDSAYQFTLPAGQTLTLPNGSVVTGAAAPVVRGGGVPPGGTPITLVGIRPFSSPNCNPLTGAGCPADGIPVFSNIFAEDSIANSSYNSLQVSLDKRFSRGLQAQVAYTWSKSIDQASSFEDFLDPNNFRRTRSGSLFDARHRFVASYYWELPIRKYSGFAGKLLNGWAVSGITQFQTGFPIRIFSYGDETLQGNFAGFASATYPDLVKPFKKLDPRAEGNLGFDPSSFDVQTSGTQGSAPRTICCGPGLNNTDISVQKNTTINERFRTEFRLDILNVGNHTKFFNPDGIFSDGSDFGRVKRAADPRLMQLALKLYF